MPIVTAPAGAEADEPVGVELEAEAGAEGLGEALPEQAATRASEANATPRMRASRLMVRSTVVQTPFWLPSARGGEP